MAIGKMEAIAYSQEPVSSKTKIIAVIGPPITELLTAAIPETAKIGPISLAIPIKGILNINAPVHAPKRSAGENTPPNKPKPIHNEDKISLKISNGLNYLKQSENYSKILKVQLNSKKTINISSKDAKGNPSVFQMIINTNIQIYSDDKMLKQKNISKNFSYKNTEKKFDLTQYEKTIEDNLINSIKEDIILILYN